MRELIKRLIDRRASLFEQMKAINDREIGEERALTTEEREQWTKLNTELDEVDARITELEELEVRAKDHDKQRERFEHVVNPDTPNRGRQSSAEEQRWRDFLSSPVDPATGRHRSLEVSLSGLQSRVDEDSGRVTVRDLSIIDGAGAGLETVPTSFRAQLYEHLIESSAMRQTNATVLTTGSGEDLQIPKTTAHGTAAIVAEKALIPENDPAFGQVTLGAFKYGVLIQVSSELIQDTAVDLLGYLSRQAGRAIGNVSGGHFVTGDGASKPRGVITAATVGKTGGTGVSGAFTADDLIDLFYSVIAEYARRGWWLMARSSEGEARKLKGSDNNYLWQPGLQVGAPNQLLGRPIVNDPNVAAVALSAKSVAFGDMSAYVIRDVVAMRFERSDDFAFANDLVTFRALLRTDGDLVDETGAVKVYQGAGT